MAKQIAILGIHTDIGKTVTAAVMAQALKADYWKPVQAGDLENSDSIKVARYISNQATRIHPEAIRLQMAASPHTAAASENLDYDCRQFKLPQTENTLLIETAGGVFSPVDAKRTVIDFVQHFRLPVVLVTKNYLGNINHTLLCLEALKQRQVPLLALIVNGERNESSETFIQQYGNVTNTVYIPALELVDATSIQQAANPFLEQWQKIL